MRENQLRLNLGSELDRNYRKSKQKIWKSASKDILASRKNRPKVNVSDISRNTKEGSRVLVPGKVLGIGKIDHKVTVGAFSFSDDARKKIAAIGGSCLNISEFMKFSSSVKDVVLLG